jgi:predicted deacylase
MATDRTPLHAYYFAPESYENTVIVTAGLHGNERLAVWALFLFLRHLSAEGEDIPALTDLRTNTRLVVVPVANPTGFSDTTRQNRNGVDLNRNFDHRWKEYTPKEDFVFGYDYKGERPHSEAETRLLAQLFRDNASASAYLDLHNFGERDRHWPWYLPKQGPNDDMIYRQVVQHFKREGDTVFSLKKTRPTSYSYVAHTFDVHASTPEFSLALFGDERYDSAGMTAAVRWYGNLIMGHAKLDHR